MVGTDMLHASLLLWVAGAGHLLHGNVDLRAIAWLLVGSIPGVLSARRCRSPVPDRLLRFAFGLVLVLSGIKLLEVPGATLIVEVGLAAGVLALAGWAWWQFSRRRSGSAVPAPPSTDRSLHRASVESRGLGPGPVDGARPRCARSNGGRVRRDRAGEARTVADLRDERDEGVLSELRGSVLAGA